MLSLHAVCLSFYLLVRTNKEKTLDTHFSELYLSIITLSHSVQLCLDVFRHLPKTGAWQVKFRQPVRSARGRSATCTFASSVKHGAAASAAAELRQTRHACPAPPRQRSSRRKLLLLRHHPLQPPRHLRAASQSGHARPTSRAVGEHGRSVRDGRARLRLPVLRRDAVLPPRALRAARAARDAGLSF